MFEWPTQRTHRRLLGRFALMFASSVGGLNFLKTASNPGETYRHLDVWKVYTITLQPPSLSMGKGEESWERMGDREG